MNVRSIKAVGGHAEDVANSNFIMDCDMFGLAETWLEKGQKVDFLEYSGLLSNFEQGKVLLDIPNLTFPSHLQFLI